jgi:hypothetical protein
MGKPYAFELQGENGYVSRAILNDSTVGECQAFNLARANGWCVIGLYEDTRGIHRKVEWRPGD